jgi:hypothetical protein
MKRIVVLERRAAERCSSIGRVKGFDTFVSDMSKISRKYKNLLKKHDFLEEAAYGRVDSER